MAGQRFLTLDITDNTFQEVESIQIGNGETDAGKIPALNSNGFIDPSLIPSFIGWPNYLSKDHTDLPYTASKNDYIFCDTSASSFTVYLPATPSMGDRIFIHDGAGFFNFKNLIVGRNGQKIMGKEEDYFCDVPNKRIEFVFYNFVHGWRVV